MDTPLGLVPLLRALPTWLLADWGEVDRGLVHLAEAVRDDDTDGVEAALRFLTGFDPARRGTASPGDLHLHSEMEGGGLSPLPDSTRELLNLVRHSIGLPVEPSGAADSAAS